MTRQEEPVPDLQHIPRSSARVFHEGSEECHEYTSTEKLTFGTSSLLPGETGAVDTGHPHSDEVFFVSRGQVRLRNPDTGTALDLEEGDVVLVPEGVPHELTNTGDEPALVTWTAAPGLHP